MSGPEWTSEPDSSPLSPGDLAQGFGPPHHTFVPDPTPEPVMDHDSSPIDPENPTAPAPSRPGFRLSILNFGSSPRTGRSPLLGLSRETRVGLAALLSFVVLIAALVVKKGGGGKSLPQARINGPADSAEAKKKAEEDLKAKKSKEALAKNDPPLPSSKDEVAKPAGPVSLPEAPKNEAILPTPIAGADSPPSPTLASNTPAPGSDPPGGEPVPKPIEPGGPVNPIALPGDPAPAPAEVPIPTASNPPPPAAPALAEVPPPSTLTTQEPAPLVQTPAPIPDVPVASNPPTPEPTPGPPATPPPPPAAAPTAVTAADPPVMAPAPVAEPSAPVLTEKAPALDPVPAQGSMAPAAETASALGAGWVVMKSGGKRAPSAGSAVEPAVVSDGPRVREDAADDQIEPVLHRVEPGENFWTISKTYYRDPRYYKALHAANQKQVPRIDELYVGTVLRIPPPESLDRSLILPALARSKVADEPTGSKITRTSRRAEPTDDVTLAMPPRRSSPPPDLEAEDEPRRPTYIVKPYETLRSIARDTLSDPRRDREILSLNRDVIDDPTLLTAGTTLTLPKDAIIGRKAR